MNRTFKKFGNLQFKNLFESMMYEKAAASPSLQHLYLDSHLLIPFWWDFSPPSLGELFFFPHQDRNPREHWLERAAASACPGGGHGSSHGCSRSGGGHVRTVSGTGLVRGLGHWVCHT